MSVQIKVKDTAARQTILNDFNIHIDNMTDGNAKEFSSVLDMFGLWQHVTEPTHLWGHTLDLGPHVQRLAWISYWNMAYAQTKMPSNVQKYPDVSMCAHAWIQAHFFCTSQRGIECTCRSTRLLPVHAPTKICKSYLNEPCTCDSSLCMIRK